MTLAEEEELAQSQRLKQFGSSLTPAPTVYLSTTTAGHDPQNMSTNPYIGAPAIATNPSIPSAPPANNGIDKTMTTNSNSNTTANSTNNNSNNSKSNNNNNNVNATTTTAHSSNSNISHNNTPNSSSYSTTIDSNGTSNSSTSNNNNNNHHHHHNSNNNSNNIEDPLALLQARLAALNRNDDSV
jgi:hypothetical protein